MTGAGTGGRVEELLRLLRSEPRASALLLDVDGTLAPIVPRPEDARVPEAVREEVARLRGRYGLVACVSGRPAEDARRVLGVPDVVVVGEHGLELEPEAEEWAEQLADFAATVDWPAERKRLSLSFHFRRADDEAGARSALEQVAARASQLGLRPRWGRKVLEIRPPVDADKGTAVAHLLADSGLSRALYAGDDTTDLDAFRALEGLDVGVRVAVRSAEGPSALVRAADIVVDGPDGVLELLRSL